MENSMTPFVLTPVLYFYYSFNFKVKSIVQLQGFSIEDEIEGINLFVLRNGICPNECNDCASH